MIVESINLKNYRNYELMNIEFSDRTNIIYGDNAQGKTNILEALYVGATTKSHRGNKDKEIIRFDSEESHLKMIVKKNDIDYRIDMHIKKNKSKGIAINGIPLKKSVDLFGIVNMVFFSPEDLNIIKDGPSERRRFMDMELSQLDKIYVHNLMQYNKVLMQRNKLLKDLFYRDDNKDTLDVWDMQLVRYGSEVIKRRTEFIMQLNEVVRQIHYKLSGGRENLSIEYVPSVQAEEFEKYTADSRNKDIRFGATAYGPHKDDIIFYINGNDVRKYGSQGQQRTAALSLKLAEIEFVKQTIHDTPVLLLDDVLSELEENRQNFLMESMGDIQTIVTCTGLEEFINNRISLDKIFKVVNGQVFPEN
ncbi:MAG: DNA replication/repair protein RecF [Clostridia bacterium]|nr:DNA replication/repair protein RecF [Clostridia bacterium]